MRLSLASKLWPDFDSLIICGGVHLISIFGCALGIAVSCVSWLDWIGFGGIRDAS